MPQNINDVTPSGDTAEALYAAVGASTRSRVVGISGPDPPSTIRIHTLAAGDTAGLVAGIRKARDTAADRILLTCEVGYEGFWLHREAPDIAIVMCDPTSLEVVRRAKVAKADPIDARRMVRALAAWDRGEAGALARVRIPTPDGEDARRMVRHRERPVRTRVRLHSTIRALLRLHGIADLAPTTRPDGTPSVEATLVQPLGIGANDATLLGAKVFCRDFRNRRELAAWAGLVAVPWASGTVAHDQGISKAGNPLVRRHPVQMAWRWVRYQPDSPITQWFRAYCAAHNGRVRKRAIVAVARKPLVALRRFAMNGLVPTGARLVA